MQIHKRYPLLSFIFNILMPLYLLSGFCFHPPFNRPGGYVNNELHDLAHFESLGHLSILFVESQITSSSGSIWNKSTIFFILSTDDANVGKILYMAKFEFKLTFILCYWYFAADICTSLIVIFYFVPINFKKFKLTAIWIHKIYYYGRPKFFMEL